jgi:hypothetical protein
MSHNQNTCNINGCCKEKDGDYISKLNLPNEKLCLQQYSYSADCNWFTYMPSQRLCILLKNCQFVNDQGLNHCISGSRDCGKYWFNSYHLEKKNIKDARSVHGYQHNWDEWKRCGAGMGSWGIGSRVSSPSIGLYSLPWHVQNPCQVSIYWINQYLWVFQNFFLSLIFLTFLKFKKT